MPLPCELLPETPPSVADILADPSDLTMRGAVVSLAPRGAAWGTDESGDGKGASPFQLAYWEAVGAAFGNLFRLAFISASQSHPSGITVALEEWEAELGLPDPCFAGNSSTEARIKAVRMKYAALGGSSPAYFICLARAAGYEISIEEPDGFECDASECDGPDYVTTIDLRTFWIVTPVGVQETWFRPDEGECDSDPLEGFEPMTDLECLLKSVAPMHTRLIFNYG